MMYDGFESFEVSIYILYVLKPHLYSKEIKIKIFMN